MTLTTSTEKPLLAWIQQWLRKETLHCPPVGIVAGNAFGFISQMYQLYKDVDLEKATSLEVQIFSGICDFFEELERARRELENPSGIHIVTEMPS